MKLATKLLPITAAFIAWSAYGSTNPTLFPSDGNIHLDRSQGIQFDALAPNAFSLQLLQVKNKFAEGNIILGGSMELDFQQWHGDQIEEFPAGAIYEDGNGFYLTQGTADIMTNITPWSTAFFSLTDSHVGRNDTPANYIYSPHAFVLLGNLDQAPFYTTFGINTIPFGVFMGSGPWDTPLTTYFSPLQAPQLSVGFYKNGWNAVATGFADQANHQNDYAYSLYYNKNTGALGYGFGVGYLNDLKSNNAGDVTLNKNLLNTSVGNFGAVVDVSGNIRYRQLTFTGEYLQGRNKINGNSGLPKAFALTADYVKTIMGKDTTFGVGTSKALSLKNIPAPLPGYDTMTSALAGLTNTWSINVARPLTSNTTLGLALQRATAATEHINHDIAKHTYTTTLDLMTYL